MNVAEQVRIETHIPRNRPPRRNGRWSGYLHLLGARMLAKGVFQATFSNSDGAAAFTVLCATNLSLPLAEWTVLGAATNIAPGLFQFTDPQAANARRFYRLRWP